MEEEKVLLKIAMDGDMTAVHFQTRTEHDIAIIAMVIDDLMRQTPALSKMMMAVRIARTIDKDFDKKVGNERVEMPDFDKILKEKD